MPNFARWSDGLAPGHGRDARGILTIGGIAADTLAERFGTPALFIDLRVLDTALSGLIDAARPHAIGISYAGKALLLAGLVRFLDAYPIGIDVSSLGELATAERAGFAAKRLTLHGAGKTLTELDAALAGRVGRLVIDGIDELRALCARAHTGALDILLRLNTGIEAHTHAFVRTAGDESKFGLAPHELDAALALLRKTPVLRVRGVHAHIGSQIYDAAPFVANARALQEALSQVHESGFAQADTMVIGGGFGVAMRPGEAGALLDSAAVLNAVAAERDPGMHVEIEPGRALVAAAGTSLYRVLAIKRFDRRRYAIVDGSMADNPRPALYDAYHHVTAVRTSDAADMPTTVSGRSCENDRLADAMLPEDLRAGDMLALCTTGAYTYSMASNYNRFERPPVIALGTDGVHPWTRRETLDDVLGLDV